MIVEYAEEIEAAVELFSGSSENDETKEVAASTVSKIAGGVHITELSEPELRVLRVLFEKYIPPPVRDAINVDPSVDAVIVEEIDDDVLVPN